MTKKTVQTITRYDNYSILSLYSEKYGKVDYIIDNEDIERVSIYNWSVAKRHHGLYAYCNYHHNRPNERLLHRFIMQVPKGMVVDHINRNTLDNRKSNMRICTLAENNQNLRKPKSTTGIRHIHICDRVNQPFHLEICKKYRKRFSTLLDAIKARNKYIRKNMKDFWNFHRKELLLDYIKCRQEEEDE